VGIRNDIENRESFAFPKPLGQQPKLYEVISGIQASNLTKKKFSPEILFYGRVPASRGRFQKIDELNDFFLFAYYYPFLGLNQDKSKRKVHLSNHPKK
jgi:DNA (cytosine-5)-methyltransferase 1